MENLENMKNKSMENLRKQKWTAMMKTLIDAQIARKESLIVNGHIIYLEDMIAIREEQKNSFVKSCLEEPY